MTDKHTDNLSYTCETNYNDKNLHFIIEAYTEHCEISPRNQIFSVLFIIGGHKFKISLEKMMFNGLRSPHVKF